MLMSLSPVADLFVRSIKTMLGDATATPVEALESRSLLANSPLPTLSMLESSSNAVVRFETSFGDFDVEMFNSAAPNTVANFLNYVRSGRYDQTFIQRSNRVNDPGSLGGLGVLQAGGFAYSNTEGLTPVPTDSPIAFEQTGRTNQARTISMARTSNPNSATSQFFINTVDNPALDPANNRFAVFGRVIQGWNVVEAIAALNRVNATTDAAFAGQFSGNFANLPVTSNYNAQTGVRENALVTFENVEVIKPTELAGFFSQELVTPEGFRSNFTTESVDMYNPNSVATRYQIIARYEVGGKDDGFNSGSRDQVIASGVINANSKARVLITSTSTSFTDLTRNGAYAIVAQFGFAETATNLQPVAAAITRDDFGTSTSEAFVNPSAFTSPQLREWTFARIERNPDSLEYMLFYNLSDTTATVTTEFVTPNGLRTVTRVIPAFTRSGIGIAEQGFGEGILAARVTSTQDIVATLTDWDIVVPTATVPRVAIPSYMVNGSAGGGSSVGSISRVVRPSTGVSELSFYNSGNTTANVNILYTGLTPLGATSVSVLPNTRVTVALDQGPTDTPVSVLFDAGLTPVTAQYTSLPEVFFPTPGLPSFRVDGFANQFASSVPTIATFAQGLFETSSNSGTSTEVVSIFNPLQSIAMTYTVTYRFSDGTSITGATGTLNGRNAIDITTQGLSNVVTKINSGANFRNYAVIVTGSANLTGGTSAFAGITNLTRVDTRTAKAVMSGPFVNGVALALSSTDVFPVVNN